MSNSVVGVIFFFDHLLLTVLCHTNKVKGKKIFETREQEAFHATRLTLPPLSCFFDVDCMNNQSFLLPNSSRV